MSKNTGTSELINYFDLGVNGDVGIAGSLDINTIANATTDTDTFLVSDTGIIKYRTGAQLLSDIGAAPAVAGGYVPYTGATTNVDLGVYSLTASSIIANGSGSNSGIVHLESNAIHSLVNGYGSIASGTTNQFNLYQTTGAGVFRGAILSLNSITEFATRTFTLPDADGTLALTSQIPANAVGGTGTTNYLPKFTGASTIGNSVIQDTGTTVTISSNLVAINGNGITEFKINNNTSEWELYMPSGSTDLRLYRGTDKVTFLANGNVGIGTASPSARLHVANSAAGVVAFLQSTATNGEPSLNLEGRNSSGTVRSAVFKYDNSDIIRIGTSSNIAMRFETNDTERMRITSGGDVYLNNAAALFFGPTSVTYITGSTTNMIFAVNDAERMRITSAGDVCIGITSALQPAANRGSLSINGVSSSILSFGVGSATKAYLYTGGTTLTIESVGASADMVFAAGNADRLKITSSGNVLIGTVTDTGARLNVGGSYDGYPVSIEAGSGGNQLSLTRGGAVAQFYMGGSTAGGTQFYVRAGGSGGVLLSAGSTGWVSASDIRLKDVTKPIENAVESLSSLQTIYYSWKDSTNKNLHIGLIAQEVEKVFPELVSESSIDGMKGVNYTELIPVIIKAIQELNEKINK